MIFILILIFIIILITVYIYGAGEKLVYFDVNCINKKIVEKAIGYKTTNKILPQYYMILMYNSVFYKNGQSKEYYEHPTIYEKKSTYFNKLNLYNILKSKYITYKFINESAPQLKIYMPVSSNKYESNMRFPVICKPATGTYVGTGIEIFNNKKDLAKFLNKKIHPEYIVQEYIQDIALFNSRKFHIRVYYLLQDTFEYAVFNGCKVMTALKPYDKNIYNNKDITDSHGKSTAMEYYHYDLPYWTTIYKQLLYFFGEFTKAIKLKYKNIKYEEPHKYNFEVYGCDFLISADYKIILVEINPKSSFRQTNYNSDMEINKKKFDDFTFEYFRWIKETIKF